MPPRWRTSIPSTRNVAVAADLLDRADREEAETHAQRLGTKVSVSTPRKTDSAASGHRADVHMAAAEALRDGGCPLRCWKAADRGGAGMRCLGACGIFCLGCHVMAAGAGASPMPHYKKLMRVTRPVCCNWRVQVGEWLGTWVLALGGIGQWRNPGDEVGKGLPNAISSLPLSRASCSRRGHFPGGRVVPRNDVRAAL
jgi:hypothetical protein